MSKRVNEALGAFDGRHVASLNRLVAEGLSEAEVQAVLAALPGSNEVGATWVLKALAEADRLSVETAGKAFGVLGQLTDGDAILHTLQMVQREPEAALGAKAEIERLLDHRRVLVRVWALDALARIDPEVSRALVLDALDAPQASLRARARALVPLVGEAQT